MSVFRKLAIHTANYSLGSVLAIVASFISFPLLTRLLSVNDYGIMSLIGAILTFVISISKLGLQHSTFRFYSDARSGRSELNLKMLLSTSVFGLMALGSAATLILLLFTHFAPATLWSDAQIRPVMAVASVLILVRILESAFINQWRAEERSGALSTYMVLRKYADLGIILFALHHVSKSVWGFYIAAILSESLGLMVIAWLTLRRMPIAPSCFSSPLFKAMLAFGIPMLGFELLSVLSIFVDRYVIQHMMSATDLGLYSAAYNLADSLRNAIIAAMTAAAVPMYNRLYTDEGREKTSAFLRQFLHIYAFGAALLLCLMAALGTDFVVLLASEKYHAAGAVLPVVLTGMTIEGLTVIVGAGLYLKKRTALILGVALAAGLLKVALSVALIGWLGIAAVAVASIVSSTLLVFALGWFGRQELAIRPPLAALAKLAGVAIATYFVMHLVWLDAAVLRLAARGLVGGTMFIALAVLLDTTLRRQLQTKVAGLKARWASRQAR